MEAAPGDIFACTNAFGNLRREHRTRSSPAPAASATPAAAPGGGAGGGGTGGGGTGGGSSGPPCWGRAADQIPASAFDCDGLDDIAVALVGMHPESVWLTRLEANLPRAALGTDLALQASSKQVTVSNIFNLTRSIGDPCATYPVDAGAGTVRTVRDLWVRNQLVLYATLLAAVAAAVGRRRNSALAGSRARSSWGDPNRTPDPAR